MSSKIMHILTRTPLHVGAGSSVGAVDMPVQRERHTQTPIIPGSSLKGVLRNLWPDSEKAERDRIFGTESQDEERSAGNLLVGEARALCFPVRSAKNAFAWITSPLALTRYAMESKSPLDAFAAPGDEQCLAVNGVIVNSANNSVVLEEYCFKKTGDIPPQVLSMLKDVFDDALWKTLEKRLVIVSDGIFAHFCAAACEVQQRIRIDEETGTVAKGALFNQENVPSETLFYAVMGERKPDANVLAPLSEKLKTVGNILQIGGDETIGLGFCSVNL
ncbi:MAG: type III-B CRISPR module RAMP protein Cmr4 [Kiritimatiellia bacterium]